MQFLKIVLTRFFIILFRRGKGIELLQLDYDTQNLFENSFIVVNYRFRNAIWYRFGSHITVEKQIKIFNLKNFEKEFDLVVYGFFQKKVYTIKLQPQLTLNSQGFKTKFQQITNDIEFQQIQNTKSLAFYYERKKTTVKIPKIKITTNPITIKPNSFNQTDFI
ncbi:MAG: hypothetical protein GZ091_08830 [Paludibacter sp.]|nr:hypothetical protein [Paludibacter sp.]